MRDLYFVYDGQNSRDFGIKLQSQITIDKAEPNLKTVEVVGRNGDLHQWDGSYSNRTATVKCFILSDQVNVYLQQIQLWTQLKPGYHRFEIPEEPDTYMMAMVSDGGKTDIRGNVLAPFTIKFNCMPQKFLKSGDVPITLTSGGTLYNAYFKALPLITVYGSGAGTLTIGGTTVTIKSIDQWVTLDCETCEAYKNADNKNSTITAPEYPALKNGSNVVAWSGDIEKIEIIPRWWTL